MVLPLAPHASAQEEATPPPAAVEETTPAAPAEAAPAEEAEAPPAEGTYEAFMAGPDAAMFTVNNLWILLSAALVFIMHLGFCSVESGMCQKKNTVNILFKNVFIVCIGALGYMAWGFNAMYPGTMGEDWNGFFAMGSKLMNGFPDEATRTANVTAEYASYTIWADFIFQAMFAATAATIVSGAVAERVKLGSFMIYATILVTFLYPITGSWKWGTGWLDAKGFYDFAGSTLVHAFGGFAALSAILILGPRRGKYTKEGVKPVLPHNLPLANIGVFMLFLGWFGFNGGSVLSADPEGVSRVFVTTAMAGFAGGLGAIFTSWIVLKKPDLSMGLNGILAGLVGITAGADVISPWMAVLVGAIAGLIVVFSVLFFDKIKIDDPVGAVSVHGICGVWGTLAVGLFSTNADHSLGTQLLGTVVISAFAFVTSGLLFFVLKLVIGVRVDAQEEEEGLDVAEHGAPAYTD
ncbi:ammonium transporter [Luteolibacter marinus]|uniref:ammonium transporter n=1 Tax=Luteolibacter marinus TaxID=2776705 RepID=UPI0018695938